MSSRPILKHNHSKWERCSWSAFKCPVFYKLAEVWEGRALEQFPDSDKKGIVINGVVFKQ
jgi:hypothetical protein